VSDDAEKPGDGKPPSWFTVAITVHLDIGHLVGVILVPPSVIALVRWLWP
jgi:hypothetical protein